MPIPGNEFSHDNGPSNSPSNVCRTERPSNRCACGRFQLWWEGDAFPPWGAQSTPDAGPAIASEDHVGVLVGLARKGLEQDFRDLGAMLGVDKEHLNTLWSGTVSRLKPGR